MFTTLRDGWRMPVRFATRGHDKDESPVLICLSRRSRVVLAGTHLHTRLHYELEDARLIHAGMTRLEIFAILKSIRWSPGLSPGEIMAPAEAWAPIFFFMGAKKVKLF